MKRLIPFINLAVVGMSEKLGMSPEAVMERCSVRELLLFMAMMPDEAPENSEDTDGHESLRDVFSEE